MKTQTLQVLTHMRRGLLPSVSPRRKSASLLALLSLLLSACPSEPVSPDGDQDGFTLEDGDCDDQNAAVHPSADEVCNGLDEDCDGLLDEALPLTIHYLDEDGDGFGSPFLPTEACGVLPGIAASGADCNDSAAEIYPGATEQEDGIDNNCDGIVDERGTERYYRDADLDGFGTPLDALESPAEGYIPSRGDCDDSSPDVHPGAPDSVGDGQDQDCGGSDGRQPHVGLSPDSVNSVREALELAAPFDLIWVGPGTYKEQLLSLHGRPVTLISTHFAAETTLDGDGLATVLVLDQGEQPTSTVDGFSIIGAPATAEGAISIVDSAPTLRNLRLARSGCSAVVILNGQPTLISLDVQGNSAANGGGIHAVGSTVTVASSTFTRNQAVGGSGGAILLAEGRLQVLDTVFDGNLASWGAGIALRNADATLDGLWMAHNLATYKGGAIALSYSDLWMDRSHLEKNAGHNAAGGIVAENSTLELTASALYENYGFYAGGLELLTTTTTLRNLSFLGNLGVMFGGAIRSVCTRLSVAQSTVVGNLATLDGGAVSHHQCSSADSLRISDSILSWNAASLFYLTASIDQALDVQVTRSLLYNPLGQLSNLPFEQSGTLETDPLFVNLSLDRNPYNDDLHLRPGSPALNAGDSSDPNDRDLDGSLLDLGASGGPGGDLYTQDTDKDGLFDGWEALNGIDTSAPSAALDPDQDGLSHLEELTLGTLPLRADSDLDGASDGDEADHEGDPLDWFLRPGGLVLPAHIPEDFPTVQAGVDAIRTQGTLLLATGTFHETLDLTLKEVTLQGAGPELTTLEGPQEGSTLTAIAARLQLSDLGITGGFPSKDSEEEYTNGSGLTVSQSEASLTRVWLHDNVAASGAGASFWRSTAQLEDCLATFNEALDAGGGVWAFFSDLTLRGGVYSDNSAPYEGGGIASYSSTMTLEDLLVERNQGGTGGGVFIQASQDNSLRRLTLTGNSASSGGGLYLWADAVLSDLDFHNNSAQVGSGLYLYYADVSLEAVHLYQNHLGMALSSSLSQLTGSNLVIFDNEASYWSGAWFGQSVVSLTNVTVMGNTSQNEGAGIQLRSSEGELTGLQITHNVGKTGFGALELNESTPTLAGLVVAANTTAGVLLKEDSVPSILNSILAYNLEGNLMRGAGQGTQTIPISYSNLYNPEGLPNMGVTTTNTSNRMLEPQFLVYEEGWPTDFHLQGGSPMVNTGAPGVQDPDGSKGDLGLYGGPFGARWDRDQDELPDYYWPGSWNDAPAGVSKGAFDEDDTDELLP